MDTTSISLLATTAMTVASVVLGAKYLKLKKLLKDIVAANEDDKVTEEEFQQIMADAKDLLK